MRNVLADMVGPPEPRRRGSHGLNVSEDTYHPVYFLAVGVIPAARLSGTACSARLPPCPSLLENIALNCGFIAILARMPRSCADVQGLFPASGTCSRNRQGCPPGTLEWASSALRHRVSRPRPKGGRLVEREGRALLRVERGEADEEEIAALLAALFVLLERAGQGERTSPPATFPGWRTARQGLASPVGWR
ncbi:acyl-CoA carboxylase epsilon subunit [Streptomyces sp. NPDC033538]|uniref:acyl-CoA carboxylase epsilon subunit n=1 Tax=Streptomyces sp. NPDC033538 TaxID=3155367 RepID=UPI0033DE37D4